MNRQIRETLTASEGRYLTPGEAKIVRSFAQRLDKSLTAVEDLEAKEDAIVDLALREAVKQSAELATRWQAGNLMVRRDLQLLLRYIAQAAVRGDLEFLPTQLFSWLEPVLLGAGLVGAPAKILFTALEQAALAELSPAASEVLRPYLAQLGVALSS
ncbi:MAG TPA: hypothetical protein PLA87_00650 [Pseudomonadota bacterium]|jgi:hypothetical protein|nr:hypothetical protein [Pseudomonadota bacterium]